MPIDLLSIGDVSIDEFMKISDASVLCDINHEHCKISFDYADKIPVEEFHTSIAGNSCNNVVSANKLGLTSAIYTEFGDDPNADKFIKTFGELGIATEYCIKNPGTSTNIHAIIVYQGERTIFSYHAPQEYIIRDWPKPKWIYYTSMPEDFDVFQRQLVDYVSDNEGIALAFNPGTFQMKAGLERMRNVLRKVSVLFVNKVEAGELVGDDTLENLHRKLGELGPKVTVITDGKNGSSAYEDGMMVVSGIYLGDGDKVVDMTGAGDAHSAAVLAALHFGKSLETALKWGSINSSGVIREVGSIGGLRTKDEIEEILSSGTAEFAEFSG